MTKHAERPVPGIMDMVEPGLRRLLAPNAGPMTGWGTNTFVLGEGSVAVVDPGPDDVGHLGSLMHATKGETITDIFITHAHLDHSGLARKLANMTGARIIGFGAPHESRSKVMQKLAASDLIAGGEGVDHAFRPDMSAREGDRFEGGTWCVDVLHTPGHFSGHLAFDIGSVLLTGDHVMDWSSSLVSPPDGDIADFIATSERLKAFAKRRFYPAHGAPIIDPLTRLNWLIDHRRSRETAILAAIGTEPLSISEITQIVYRDIPVTMHVAAERNVLAHLIDLIERKVVTASPEFAIDALFHRAQSGENE